MEFSNFIIEDGVLTDCTVEYERGDGRCIVPDGVHTVAESFLSVDGEVEYLYLPASVERICPDAFGGCQQINAMEIHPENPVYRVEGNCIVEQSTRTVVVGGSGATLPADTEIIGSCAFHARNGIGALKFPESLRVIEPLAFCWTDLQEAQLPEGLEELGFRAFALNNDLHTVTLPSTLREMDYGVFVACGKIQRVTVAPQNPYYYEEEGCVVERDTMTLMVCTGSTVPDGVEIIPPLTVSLLTDCGSVYLPASVQEIGADNFTTCRQLLRDENNEVFGQINFILRAPAGSYAIEYAKQHGLHYLETEK